MDFRLSDETLEWQQYCRKFAREVMRPAAPLHDREESVPYEVINAAYEWKLTGLDWLRSLQTDPEGLKGVIYAEELHWGCAGIALAISASALCAAGIASSGTPEQIGALDSGGGRLEGQPPARARMPSPSRPPGPTSSRCARPPSATATTGS